MKMKQLIKSHHRRAWPLLQDLSGICLGRIGHADLVRRWTYLFRLQQKIISLAMSVLGPASHVS